jgi:DNA-binding response OmpR family regulator
MTAERVELDGRALFHETDAHDTASQRPRLLVVDDEPAICELIGDVSRAAGYDVTRASERADVDRLIGDPFDITVLDLDLGRLVADDDDLLRTLAMRRPGARIVFVSGSDAGTVADAHRRAATYGLRVLGSCQKPFDLTAFRRVLLRDDDLLRG